MPTTGSVADRRDGFYTFAGNKYVSVTHALTMLSWPPFSEHLKGWFAKKAAQAGDAKAGDKIGGERAAEGTQIHKVAEAAAAGVSIPVPEKLAGFGRALSLWHKEHNVTVVHSERTVRSEKHRCAGTMDGVGAVDGVLCGYDYKTVDSPDKLVYDHPFINHICQGEAYRWMFYEQTGELTDGVVVVRLARNGQYRQNLYKFGPSQNNPAWNVFAACVAAVHAYHENKDMVFQKGA